MTLLRAATAGAVVVTALLVQACLIGPWTFPVPVSLPALLVILVGIYAGPGIGLGLGFSAGLLADLGSEHPVGVQALCWLGGGLLAGIVGGLATERGYGTRGVAAVGALLGMLTEAATTTVLAVLGSHAASLDLAVRYLVPVGLADALLGLVLAPFARALLRAQRIHPPRPATELIGGLHAGR